MNRRNRNDNRHRTSDRRHRDASRDILGSINEPTYKGPDRRSGLDRRALYRQAQKRRVRSEQMKFLLRTLAGSSLAVASVVALSVVLLLPEYANWDKFLQSLSKTATEVTKSIPKNVSLGALVNRKIKEMENGAAEAANLYASLGWSDGEASVSDLSLMLDRIRIMQHSMEESAVVEHSIANLRTVIYQTANDPARMQQVIETARQYDTTLGKMLGNVGSKDVAAAAMLLALNQFRSNVYNGRPYHKDIALLKRLAGNDPEMSAALDRLQPFAEKGAITQEALEAQLQGLAQDIILAKVKGEDVDVQQAAMARFNNYMAAAEASDIRGEEDAAVVARAQKLLDQGQVKAAMAELQKLQGSGAEAAEPWMQNAETNVMLGQSSDMLVQNIIGSMAGGGAGGGVQNLVDTIKSNMGRGGGAAYLSPALQRR